MKPLDKNHLALQFKVKIFTKDGSEFQSFFENIMEKAFDDFQKIRPYGSDGDGGNDGYRRDNGDYYQVYSPLNPEDKESEAAKKLEEDFKKVCKNWNSVAPIKSYNFVFNDKGKGSVLRLENALSELRKVHSGVNFKLFLTKDLEKYFLELSEEDLLNLNFNIDLKTSTAIAYKHFKNIEIALDRSNIKYAKRALDDCREIVRELSDDGLTLEFELLECRCLQGLQLADEAIAKYENLAKRYPKDPRATLHLAEIHLFNGEFEMNKIALEKARRINGKYWLLEMNELMRRSHLKENIDLNVQEDKFPTEAREKASFYRLYAILFNDSGDTENADSFIERAIHLYPNGLGNYIARLVMAERRISLLHDRLEILKKTNEIIAEIERIEKMFSEFGEIGIRATVFLNLKKISATIYRGDMLKIGDLPLQTLELLMECYFDTIVDRDFVELFNFFVFPSENFDRFLKYLGRSKTSISDDLAKALITKFIADGSLFSRGKAFFKSYKKHLDFIESLETENFDGICMYIYDDFRFTVKLAVSLKDSPMTRRALVNKLPSSEDGQKELLLAFINYDEGKIDEAFECLKNTNLSNLHPMQYEHLFKIFHDKNAWDFCVHVLKEMAKEEHDPGTTFKIDYYLHDNYLRGGMYEDAMILGERLLERNSSSKYLDINSSKNLLHNTLLACLERGKVNEGAFQKAKEICESYQMDSPSFVFSARVLATVYLKTNEPRKALESIIAGVKDKRSLTEDDYLSILADLIEISKKIGLTLDSPNPVEDDSFVKLKNGDRWYYVGDGNELDARRIERKNTHYKIFTGKRAGDTVTIKGYASNSVDDEIEHVFTIEKYVFWKTIRSLQVAGHDPTYLRAHAISVLDQDGKFDLNIIENFLDEVGNPKKPVIEMYFENTLPFAILAAGEGGILQAFDCIQNKQQGYVNFRSGTVEEFELQKDVTNYVLDKTSPFYLDGTSAWILAETGLLKTVSHFLPNMRTPRSVLNFLIDTFGKVRNKVGEGQLRYIQGKIVYIENDIKTSHRFESNIEEGIQVLESKPENLYLISKASKVSFKLNDLLPDELTDACELSLRDEVPILTDDYLYLIVNGLETNRQPPKYFSLFALITVLYEKKMIEFGEYLDFFYHLSLYRFRFLSISVNDLEKAIFGDKAIKHVDYSSIKKLNLPLTLSEEYGVPPQTAFRLVVGFLHLIVFDSTIPRDILERIFIELVEVFPTSRTKDEVSKILLGTCSTLAENEGSTFIYTSIVVQAKERIKWLSDASKIWS